MAKELTFDLVTTKGGDKGETSDYSMNRLRKDDFLFEALGDLDELNSYIGILKAELDQDEVDVAFSISELEEIQENIIRISGLAALKPKDEKVSALVESEEKQLHALEFYEARLFNRANIKAEFIKPGGNLPSAHADYTRTLARRCERRIVSLIRDRGYYHLHGSQVYINRLSDYFFVLARYLCTSL